MRSPIVVLVLVAVAALAPIAIPADAASAEDPRAAGPTPRSPCSTDVGLLPMAVCFADYQVCKARQLLFGSRPCP